MTEPDELEESAWCLLYLLERFKVKVADAHNGYFDHHLQLWVNKLCLKEED